MEEVERMNTSNESDIQYKYAKADRFAWSLMVGLSFAAFIALHVIVRDFRISLIVGCICFIGLVSRELYLHWIFGGPPPLPEGKPAKPTWRGHILHIAFVMSVWMVLATSGEHFSVWSFAGALMTGGGLALYLWWQQSRTSIKKRPIR